MQINMTWNLKNMNEHSSDIGMGMGMDIWKYDIYTFPIWNKYPHCIEYFLKILWQVELIRELNRFPPRWPVLEQNRSEGANESLK